MNREQLLQAALERVIRVVPMWQPGEHKADCDCWYHQALAALSAPPAPVGGGVAMLTDDQWGIFHARLTALDEAGNVEPLLAYQSAWRAALCSPPLQGDQGFSSVAGASPSRANEPATDREVVE